MSDGIQKNYLEKNMSEPTISPQVETHVDKRLKMVELFTSSLYVDTNSVDASISAVKELEAIEQLLDNDTGKTEDWLNYKAKSDLIKPFVERADKLRKTIRQKIWIFVTNGGLHKYLSLRRDGYEAIINDVSSIPVGWMTPDIDKMQKMAKKLDGNLEIPGVTFKPKTTLIIKTKDKEE